MENSKILESKTFEIRKPEFNVRQTAMIMVSTNVNNENVKGSLRNGQVNKSLKTTVNKNRICRTSTLKIFRE